MNWRNPPPLYPVKKNGILNVILAIIIPLVVKSKHFVKLFPSAQKKKKILNNKLVRFH